MKNLQETLEELDNSYLEMLKYLNRAIDLNIEALESRGINPSIIGEIKMNENFINDLEVRIKENAIITMALFQPAATDLRKLVMYINSVRVIERMGDLLKGSVYVIRLIEEKNSDLYPHLNSKILPLIKQVKIIYETYINALVTKDEKVLYSLLAVDSAIDEVFSKNTNYVIELMKSDVNFIEGGTLILLLDKKYERVSDHISHLVQDLIYILKGDNIRKSELLQKS
ncbi:MAG: phosphate signaling complex PhoU family protein [Fusobacteriaceae bacterium]